MKLQTDLKRQRGLTLVELIFVILIIGILIGMLLPAVRRVRPAARRTQCMNNLRQIALATVNYESAHMKFPSGTGLDASGIGSSDQLSGFVAILPFIEQQDLYDQIANESSLDGIDFPAFPPLDAAGFQPWETRVPTFICPSVSGLETDTGPVHYGHCIGDRARNIASAKTLRGGFDGLGGITFDDLTDGSSNTIMAAEIGGRLGKPINQYAVRRPESILENPAEVLKLRDGSDPNQWDYRTDVVLSDAGRGSHWADGRAGVALFNTILPPNSPSAAIEGTIDVDGIYSASGPHPSGVVMAKFDGSTHLVDLEVDAGDPTLPTPTEPELESGVSSPYGVWGALGSINGGEIVDEY